MPVVTSTLLVITVAGARAVLAINARYLVTTLYKLPIVRGPVVGEVWELVVELAGLVTLMQKPKQSVVEGRHLLVNRDNATTVPVPLPADVTAMITAPMIPV